MVCTDLIPWLSYLGINGYPSVSSVLETLHVATCIHMLYTYLVIGFANPEMTLNILWWVIEDSDMVHWVILNLS